MTRNTSAHWPTRPSVRLILVVVYVYWRVYFVFVASVDRNSDSCGWERPGKGAGQAGGSSFSRVPQNYAEDESINQCIINHCQPVLLNVYHPRMCRGKVVSHICLRVCLPIALALHLVFTWKVAFRYIFQLSRSWVTFAHRGHRVKVKVTGTTKNRCICIVSCLDSLLSNESYHVTFYVWEKHIYERFSAFITAVL